MAATLPSRRPPHHKSVSPQRVAQYDPYAHQLGSLSENIHRLLTERECSIYDRALTDYHRRRHIRPFVECLSHVLNTNQKRQLLIPIRDSYIKPSDLSKFNQLALELGLATPLKKKKSDTKGGVKKIEIKRNYDGEWGFNIRGGSEHGIGIFVSSVEPGSNAAKSGLKAGDQIKKANDLNCESVTHHEAVTMMKNSKKLQLWVLSRGHIPTSRMAHKVYNWVDPQGRPASPPPDPFELQEQLSSSSKTLLVNQPDERKVTMMIENGQQLGISIRGGAEHGLGIYISAVEEGSVAETYGVNVGDQILEVNGISFLGIVHSDAAHALRAQPCMVMKLKDVGKLPHSRVTTLGKTQWYPTSGSRTLPTKRSRSPVFTPGYGTQMMLSDQENSFQVRGMMNEVARSVLTSQELNTFNYYVDQYDQNSLSIDDLVTPMLHLLTTPEKLQLLSEMHVVIKPQDLQRFNELTVHKALAVKKAGRYHGRQGDSFEGSFSPGGGVPSHTHSTPKSKGPVKRSVVAQVHAEEQPNFQMNPYEAEDHTLTHDSSSEDGGRDKIPQKLSPSHPTFRPPPPPPSAPKNGHVAAKNTTTEDTWSATWNDSSMMSPPPKGGGSGDADSSVNISEIEKRVRSETEARLRREFEEQQQQVINEQQQRLKQEQAELEDKIRRDAEESMKKQLREKEEALARMTLQHQDKTVDKAQLEKEIKKELEEKIWREAEEHLRDELERKMQRELETTKPKESTDSGASNAVDEEQIRREMEQKYRREYEEKIRREQEKWKKKQEEDRRKQEQESEARREAEVARLEAEEQAKIELEDRIRKEAEASARAEYEARLQHETEERARLAAEVKARKALEERMEKERIEREKEQERVRQRQREKEKERRERELASAKKAPTKPIQNVRDAAEEEEDENSEEEEEPMPQQMTPEELEEQRMLDMQRQRRIREEKEEQRQQEAQKRALAAEKAKKDEELRKKKELARKREENIRKLEKEKERKEAEARQKREEERRKKQQQEMEEKQSTIERERQLQSKKRQEEEVERQKGRAEAERIRKQKVEQEQKKTEANRLTKMGGKQVMVGGTAKNGASSSTRMKRQAQAPTSKAAAVEEERDKAEQMLERKLREKKVAAAASKPPEQKSDIEEVTADENAGPSFSYAGYNNLCGELKHVLVTKVVRKLGIAIDGGANTKQKAVIIREISPEGCAGQTASELKVNQQLLEIEGQSLNGLKHKDVVMCIKHAFEGELGKVIDFTVLEPYN